MADRHEGFKRQLKQMHDGGIRRTIRSLQHNISSHEHKIDTEPDSHAIQHWREEIAIWREQLAPAINEAQNRGIYEEDAQ